MQTRKKNRTTVDDVCLVRKIAPSTVSLQFLTSEKKIVLLSKKNRTGSNTLQVME